MCYSAQIWADYNKYVRVFGADIDIHTFVDIYWTRQEEGHIKIPKGMDLSFLSPKTDEARQIRSMIDAYDQQQASLLEQELFQQTKRLNDAERTLKDKTKESPERPAHCWQQDRTGEEPTDRSAAN